MTNPRAAEALLIFVQCLVQSHFHIEAGAVGYANQ